MHQQAAEQLDRSPALIAIRQVQRPAGPRRGRVPARLPGLDRRLLVRADDEVALPSEPLGAFVEGQNRNGPFEEARVSGPLPAMVPPRLDAVVLRRWSVAREMRRTMPRRTTARASSVADQRESGLPECRGRVQASAVTCARTAEGEKAWSPGRRRVLQSRPRPAAPPPPAHRPVGAAHGPGNGRVAQSGCS